MDQEIFSPEELQNPFDAIKETEEEGGELQLSTAIKKKLNPSDNCNEQGGLFYNLDAIISVGYLANWNEATLFCKSL